MKMKYFLAIIIGTTLLFACSENSKNLDEMLVDTSRFIINDSILKNGDYVEILGATDKLSNEDKFEFYNLIVVRSERTGDTVNILTTKYFVVEPNNPRTQFISGSSLMGKLFDNASNLKVGESIHPDSIQTKKFDKVLFDTEFIQVDVYNYPSIIGNLGLTFDGDLEMLDQ